MSGCYFEGNEALRGGAIYVQSAVIRDSVFIDNISFVALGAFGPPGVPDGTMGNPMTVDRLTADGQDLLIWQANYPTETGATGAVGDSDGDGDVDGRDFLEWQAHNGGPPAMVAATMVPEPATWLLLACGWMLLTGTLYRPGRLCRARVRR